MTELTHTHTLERLIDQQIELGHHNPHDYPQLLAKALGDNLNEIIKPYIDDFIAEMSRQRINNRRRAQIAKITPTTINQPEIMIQSLWIPTGQGNTITYKPLGTMTADDFDARADYLERMSLGIHRHAQWCRTVANNMRDQNVTTANQLGNLPALPEYEDLPELPALTA
jgi:hypothetical protein